VADVILFDFFGTLVRYQPDRTALAYPRSHGLLAGWGWRQDHDDFVTLWDQASRAVEAASSGTYEEPSMLDFSTAFGDLAELDLAEDQLSDLATCFVEEWSQHVQPIAGAHELLQALSRRYRLGIVSNTNDTAMVPRIVADHFTPSSFEHTLLSVEHGFRKPHRSIYEAALRLFDVEADQTLFVGDSFEADYRGPTGVGMRAFLIDPDEAHQVPADHRLTSVLELTARL
jgi:putative hydrolase of the HAD superfamily